MKKKKIVSQFLKVGGGMAVMALAPGAAWGCACGCGIFEVGTSSMFPEGSGGMAFQTYAFQNQNQNWSDSSKTSAANNADKNITTSFLSTGLQYMFNRSWGAEVEIPYAYRSFTTLNNPTLTGNTYSGGTPVTMKWWSLGDIRLHGIYTGFSEDMSSGIDFGVKLPTGNFSQEDAGNDIDRDSEIGTGSTDILLGGFHRGNLISSARLDWYAQMEADLPVLTQGDYRPGFEIDGAAGVNYRGFHVGHANIAPLAQILVSERTRDLGEDAAGGLNDSPPNGINSGFTRVLVSPGIDVHIHPIEIYADVEVPVFQHFNGSQLAAPYMFKMSVSYMF
jgi:hypothetical protein